MAKSLAILSDAAHLMTDLSSFVIAIMAANIAMKPANPKYTYGMMRTEVLSALFSISILILLTIYFVVESGYRIFKYTQGTMDPVDGKLMTIVAGIGILVNVALALVLGEHHVHMAGDDHGHDHSHGHGHHDDPHDHHHDDHHDHHDDHHDHHDDHNDEGCCGHDHDHGHDHGHGHGHGHGHHDEEEGMVTLASSGKRHRGKKKRGKKHKGKGEEEHELSLPLMAYGATDYDHHDHHDHHNDHHDHHDHHGHHDDHHDHSDDHHSEKKSNINLDAAFLHVLGDLIQSVAVFLAGLLIMWKPHWQVADPICTILFSFVVFYTTNGILKSTTNVLMEGTPKGIDWDKVNRELRSIPGVRNVHDLHIWSISIGKPAMTVHCIADDPRSAMLAIKNVAKKNKISHSTVQIQDSSDPECLMCADG
eukprot:CAMPEP_0118665106 /NCGR_PEP_ID=MMETSP0785-20121206/18423_1 /TAXON_ID=91992 /ORGANISM="Bolidomonas pacifica, Strain CCMP 1866" /LENGTH=419 /DNA_ID=CAMNT_0006559165 /DNA_START=166 /DNA_END=1422 /DNA_ORIENTATION=-